MSLGRALFRFIFEASRRYVLCSCNSQILPNGLCPTGIIYIWLKHYKRFVRPFLKPKVPSHSSSHICHFITRLDNIVDHTWSDCAQKLSAFSNPLHFHLTPSDSLFYNFFSSRLLFPPLYLKLSLSLLMSFVRSLWCTHLPSIVSTVCISAPSCQIRC